MTKRVLLTKIETILDEFKADPRVEDYRDRNGKGLPNFVRRSLTEKIAQENNRAQEATYR